MDYSALLESPMTLEQFLLSIERNRIMDAMDRHHGNVAASARDLGIPYRAMRYRLTRLGEWSQKPLDVADRPQVWSKLRLDTLERYGRRCLCCGATPDIARIEVDHIKPRDQYPHLAMDLDNLQVLCVDCNKGKGAQIIDYRPKVDGIEPLTYSRPHAAHMRKRPDDLPGRRSRS